MFYSTSVHFNMILYYIVWRKKITNAIMCMHRHTLSQSAFYMYSIDPIYLLLLEWKKGRRNQTERTFNQFTFAFSGQISLLEYRFCFFFVCVVYSV